MEGLNTQSSEAELTRGKNAKRPRVGPRRGRARVEAESRPRVARPRRPERDRADLDGLYLTEMAASTVLTPEQETELGKRIAAAERSVLEGVVRAPSGARALVALANDLGAGILDVRDLILNPDEQGLDIEAVSRRLVEALHAAGEGGEPAERAVDTLATVRLDTELVDRLVTGLEEAVKIDTHLDDAAQLAAVELAERELRRAKERLVVGNLRLVVLFARKYQNRGVPLLDLVQEGNLGLMRAAEKFDHRRGFRFSTYAAWWIKQALQRALLDRTLRLPVHVADDRRRVGKARAIFVAQHAREPNVEEIARATGLAVERIGTVLTLPAQPSSLDAPVGDEGDAKVGDFVHAGTPAPDDAAALHALGGQLLEMLEGLAPREQEVLRMRFGIGYSREHTLEEVGHHLSLTRERIRQIERAALGKLRARSDRVELSTYLEGP